LEAGLSEVRWYNARVEVHIASSGDPEADRKLSRERADAIVRWVFQRNPTWTSDYKLEAVGCGADVPLVRAKSPEARAANERVVFLALPHRRMAAKGQ
jgi:outer membrane protein OmpA-like peptidoglycan-associated protein